MPYTKPIWGTSHYSCPNCAVDAVQSLEKFFRGPDGQELWLRKCGNCGHPCIWERIVDKGDVPINTYGPIEPRILFPLAHVGPPPHEDMPKDVRDLYLEASEVGALSSRAAAAILRLALQVLLEQHLGLTGKINEMVGRLSKGGEDKRLVQAMDVLRVIGNNAVHPGTIDLNEDPALLVGLFGLINLVVEEKIGIPRRVDQLTAILPQGALEAIAKRDAKKT